MIEFNQSRFHRWWPFALLLLAGASRWGLAAARPDAGSTLGSEAVGCAWAALAALTYLIRRPNLDASPQPSSNSVRLRWVLSGAMFIGGPAAFLLFHGEEFDFGSLTIALALTPVVIAIATSALGIESSDGIAGRVWPGLAAVAGLLLVLAQPALGDARTDLVLVLAPALTGLGAVLFCMDQPSSAYRVAAALLGASALFAIALAEASFVAGTQPSVSLLAIACDGILALLGVVTLAQLGLTRWSSQFTWVPLLIILEGILLVRPALTTHWVVGLALLVVASVYLLLPQSNAPTSGASPIPTLPA